MPDDDDLPDHDFRSIYGDEALAARQQARLRAWSATMDAITARQRQTLADIHVMLTRLEAKHGDPRDEG